MVTKYSGEAYDVLFKKATEELKSIPGSGIESITTLDEYFRALQIPSLTQKNPLYAKLPLDEAPFVINANTREIQIPNSFARGASVQSDHLAETVYFEIDRYFDAIDLASKEMNIAILWERSDGTQGINKEFLRDCDSKPGKFIFGWALSNEITEIPGNVRFSVRFYTVIEERITYCFNSLSAVIKINQSLPMEDSEFLSRAESRQGFENDILDRIRNLHSPVTSGINTEIQPPVFITNLASTMDLNEDGEAVLVALARKYVSDNGEIGPGNLEYNWEYKPSNSNSFTIIPNENTIDEYEKITSIDEYDKGVYYYADINGQKQWITTDSVESYLESGKDVYIKKSIYKANTVGTYKVVATNRYGLTSANTDSVLCVIPAPHELSVIPKSTHLILNGNESIDIQVNVDSKPEGNAYEYKWYQGDSSNSITEIIPTENSSQLTVNNTNKEEYTFNKYYALQVTASRNKARIEDTSRAIRVTSPIQVPKITLYQQEENKEFKQIPNPLLDGNEVSGFLKVEASAPLTDYFSYEWQLIKSNSSADFDKEGVTIYNLGADAKLDIRELEDYRKNANCYLRVKVVNHVGEKTAEGFGEPIFVSALGINS